MSNIVQFLVILVVGSAIVLAITHLGLRRDDRKFQKEFGFDINATDAE